MIQQIFTIFFKVKRIHLANIALITTYSAKVKLHICRKVWIPGLKLYKNDNRDQSFND
jgi:hypothetical protein